MEKAINNAIKDRLHHKINISIWKINEYENISYSSGNQVWDLYDHSNNHFQLWICSPPSYIYNNMTHLYFTHLYNSNNTLNRSITLCFLMIKYLYGWSYATHTFSVRAWLTGDMTDHKPNPPSCVTNKTDKRVTFESVNLSLWCIDAFPHLKISSNVHIYFVL